MKKLLIGFLVLLNLGSVSAATVVVTGPLYGSGDPAYPSYPDGGYSMSLSGTTVTYSISTRPVAQPVLPVDYGLLLGATAGSIFLPFSSHYLMGMSGCRPVYGSERAVSFYSPESGTTVPFEFVDPGICDAYFQMSVFFGSLELSPTQVLAFIIPDFSVTVLPLGLSGRTNPDIITIVPEPSSGILLFTVLAGFVGRRSRTPRANLTRMATPTSPSFLDMPRHFNLHPAGDAGPRSRGRHR